MPARVRSLVLVDSWARNDDYTRALFRTWQRVRTRCTTREFLESATLFAFGHRFLNTIGLETLVAMSTAAPHPQDPQGFVRQVEAFIVFSVRQRGEAVDAGSVIEKLSHGNAASMRRCFRNVLRHIVVEPEFAFFDEQHDRRHGELLRYRADLVDG